MINLSVNVNKVATLRNARGGDVPNVMEAARTCVLAGCQGITVHPREDQRHIRPGDVHDIVGMLRTDFPGIEFNIEGDPRPDLIDMVLEVKPEQFTLVPVEPGEVTSHHGFDLEKDGEILEPVIKQCRREGIRISLFMDAEADRMAAAAAVGADRVELYTGPYAAAATDAEIEKEFEKLGKAHDAALTAGLELNAGHDLDVDNLPRLQQLTGIKEASIGHALISRAIYVGLEQSVKDFLRACGHEV